MSSIFLPYSSFKAAVQASQGYESPSVIAHYSKLVNTSSQNANMTILFNRREVFNVLLSSLKLHNEEIKVVWDIGGGNGYFRGFVPAKDLKWCVVESPAMAKLYSETIEVDGLSFHSDISSLPEPTLVIVSCVLQYVEFAEQLLLGLLAKASNLIIMRHPESDKVNSSYFVQQILLENDEHLSWPIRIFEKNWLRNLVGTSHQILNQIELEEQIEKQDEIVKLMAYSLTKRI